MVDVSAHSMKALRGSGAGEFACEVEGNCVWTRGIMDEVRWASFDGQHDHTLHANSDARYPAVAQ